MGNDEEQAIFSALELEQFYPWGYITNTCIPSYEQAQKLFTTPNSFPLPSPPTMEEFAVSAEHSSYCSLHTRNATTRRSVDFGMASEPVSYQSQWSRMGSGLTNGTCAPVPKLQSRYHMPHDPLCGWSRDFEPFSIPVAIPSIPQSVSPALGTPSYVNMAQHDTYMLHVLGDSVVQDTYTSSPDGDDALTASGFLCDFADYDFPTDACKADPQPPIAQYDAWMSHTPDGCVAQGTSASSLDGDTALAAPGCFHDFANYSIHLDARADPQPPTVPFDPQISSHVLDGSVVWDASASSSDAALSASASTSTSSLRDFANYDFLSDAYANPQIALTHKAISPVQSAAVPSGEWIGVPDLQTRTTGCQWVTNDTLCELPVMAERRNVVEHLQKIHGIKPGEEKSRQTCLWDGCRMALNKESLARHILAVHLKEKAYCAECGLYFAREDSLKRHLKGGQHRGSCDKNAARRSSRSRASSW